MFLSARAFRVLCAVALATGILLVVAERGDAQLGGARFRPFGNGEPVTSPQYRGGTMPGKNIYPPELNNGNIPGNGNNGFGGGGAFGGNFGGGNFGGGNFGGDFGGNFGGFGGNGGGFGGFGGNGGGFGGKGFGFNGGHGL
jgi:hypothetical protein